VQNNCRSFYLTSSPYGEICAAILDHLRQVIFYYSSEKDTLEQANAELWIDDNIKEPQHLTLGRILKRNRIDRISV
jgi:hypothetical protein